MAQSKAVNIPLLDGKDVYIANHYINNSLNGYTLRDKFGDLNIKKFVATMDYSLDLIKLNDVYKEVYRNRNFYEYVGRNKKYTRHVINVTFKYSNKLYNRAGSGLYIKFGYSPTEITLENNTCIKDGTLIAIRVLPDGKEKNITEDYLVKSPLSQEILGEYFFYDKELSVYRAKDNIETLTSISDIRTDLYENGFVCDGIKYVRFKRSSGSSRVGKCLFIDEKLYKKMHKWEMCGLNVKNGVKCDLASLEPYIALTLSSIIDTITIEPNEILVIPDYESKFTTTCVATELDKDNRLVSSAKQVDMSNSIWDGQSLLDVSKFEDYKNYGMLLLRTRFFKSACFNTNIQQWFTDNGITDISQLNGYTQATTLSDIKLITTPSSIKYLKFGSLEDWLWTIEPQFGVVKHEKPTHYFDGRMVQTHYQLLNTLQLTKDEVEKFIQPTIDYIMKLKTDSAVFRHHIKYSIPEYTNAESQQLVNKNDIVYYLLGLNNKFSQTKMYKDFCNETVKAFVKNCRKGHIFVHGNYSTLFGNPIEMLQSCIGQFNGEPKIKAGTVHCTMFNNGDKLIGSRSPHVTMGNILCCQNVIYEDINKYFNLSNEIVCVNSIRDNLLERLSGSDFDSDTVLLTDNKILYQAAIRNYDNFLVPTKLVSSKKCERRYTARDKAELDIKTGTNKIGEIINLSQELNSKLWELIYNGYDIQSNEVQSLYADIAQLDVMSNLEIDSAKRENPANNSMELKLLKAKYAVYDNKGRYVRPLFFKYLDKYKGYDNNRKHYRLYNTTMDYVELALNKIPRVRNNAPLLNLSDIFKSSNAIDGQVYYEQVERILSAIQDTKDEIGHLWSKYKSKTGNVNKGEDAFSYEQCLKMTEETKEDCVEYINSLKISKKTMRYLLSLIEKPTHKNYSALFLSAIFTYHNINFDELVADSQENVFQIKECPIESEQYDIKLYDFNYRYVSNVNT